MSIIGVEGVMRDVFFTHVPSRFTPLGGDQDTKKNNRRTREYLVLSPGGRATPSKKGE